MGDWPAAQKPMPPHGFRMGMGWGRSDTEAGQIRAGDSPLVWSDRNLKRQSAHAGRRFSWWLLPHHSRGACNCQQGPQAASALEEVRGRGHMRGAHEGNTHETHGGTCGELAAHAARPLYQPVRLQLAAAVTLRWHLHSSAGAQPAPGRRTVSIQAAWLEDGHAPRRLQLAVVLLLRHSHVL